MRCPSGNAYHAAQTFVNQRERRTVADRLRRLVRLVGRTVVASVTNDAADHMRLRDHAGGDRSISRRELQQVTSDAPSAVVA